MQHLLEDRARQQEFERSAMQRKERQRQPNGAIVKETAKQIHCGGDAVAVRNVSDDDIVALDSPFPSSGSRGQVGEHGSEAVHPSHIIRPEYPDDNVLAILDSTEDSESLDSDDSSDDKLLNDGDLGIRVESLTQDLSAENFAELAALLDSAPEKCVQ